MKPGLLLLAVLSACHHGAAAPATPDGPDLHDQLYVVTGDLATDVPGADRLLPGLDAKLDGLLEAAGDVITAWPTGGAPTRAQVDASGAKSALLIGAITSLTSAPSAEQTEVSCKLSLTLMSYPERSMYGVLDGSATVKATADPADIGRAEQACVDAVLEDLLTTKVLPAIRNR